MKGHSKVISLDIVVSENILEGHEGLKGKENDFLTI